MNIFILKLSNVYKPRLLLWVIYVFIITEHWYLKCLKCGRKGCCKWFCSAVQEYQHRWPLSGTCVHLWLTRTITAGNGVCRRMWIIERTSGSWPSREATKNILWKRDTILKCVNTSTVEIQTKTYKKLIFWNFEGYSLKLKTWKMP